MEREPVTRNARGIAAEQAFVWRGHQLPGQGIRCLTGLPGGKSSHTFRGAQLLEPRRSESWWLDGGAVSHHTRATSPDCHHVRSAERLTTFASDTGNHDVADRSHVLTRCTITRDHTEHSAGWSRCSAMRIVVHDSDALLLKEQRGRVTYAVRFPASAPAGRFGPCTPGRAPWCSPPTAKARRLRGRCRSGLPSATPSAARPRCARKLRPLRRRPVRTGAPLPIPVLRLASPC